MAREVERTNRPCECGAKLYGYKDQQNSRIYLCYKCGKYKGKNVPDDLYSLSAFEGFEVNLRSETGQLITVFETGDGKSSERIFNILKQIKLNKNLLDKKITY